MEAAFPSRIALTTKDGQVVTFSKHTDPVVTPGVMSPTGKVVVSASFMAGRTMVEWHDVRTDEISPRCRSTATSVRLPWPKTASWSP